MTKRLISLMCFVTMICNIMFCFPVSAKTITVFSQTDSRWANHQYGYSNTAGTTPATISSGGCGILAYVNAVYYLNGKFIQPVTLADWSVSHGYRVNGVGTALGLYSAFANAEGSTYGIAYNGSSSSYDTLKQHLQNGEVAVGSAPGHLMAIVDYNSSDSTFLILDSYKSTNRKTYETGYTWQTAAACRSIDKLNFSSFYFIKSTTSTTPDTTPDLTADSSFPSNIKAYPIGTGNLPVYASAGGSAEANRYITGSTDECTIKQVYTNGWCLVNYPSGDKTRDAFVPLTYFINQGTSHSSGTGLAATVYKRSDMSQSYGSVYASDTYTIVGASGDKKQIIYPVTGGYKMGWVTIATPSPVDNSFPKNIKAYTIGTGNQAVYASVGGSAESNRYITGSTDLCTIKEVYSNGWCYVNYPTATSSRDAYVPFSYFVNSGVDHYTGKGVNVTVYRRSDLSESLGSVYTADTYTVVGKSGDKIQLIYPLDAGGYKMGWVSSSALDSTKPSVSNLKVAAADNSSFTVTVTATDNQSVGSVKVAVWTDSNGQDDLKWYDMTGNGSSYSAKINISDHGNQTGNYLIHVYAYDVAGNQGFASITYNFQIKYTVNYNANGGEGAPDSQTKIKGTNLTLSTTVPSRENYSFEGWATSPSATSAQYKAGATFTTEANTTLYAVWEWNKYTIAYDANGGSGAPGSQTKTKGSSLTLSSTVPTRSGYTFEGWSTDESSTVQYKPGDKFTADLDVILYAVWSEKKYTLSYNANNGTGAPSSQEGTTITISSVAPTRSGYTFEGWSKTSTGSVQYKSGDKITLSGNTTLYAVWTEEKAKVKLGDVNNDGEIDFADATLILQADAGTKTLTADQKAAADVNGDGDVDFADATLVLQYDCGKIKSF